MEEKSNIIQSTSNVDWLPDFIVGVLGEISWPLVAVFVVWKFRDGLMGSFRDFFNKNKVTEVSANHAGITAKFEAQKEVSSVSLEGDLQPDKDYQQAQEYHEHSKTDYSEEFYKSIRKIVASWQVPSEQKIDVLLKEVSILDQRVKFERINSVMFRSQFELFNLMPESGKPVPVEELQKYFDGLVADNSDLGEWKLEQYLQYPVSSEVLEKSDQGYSLTTYGKSYVKFMKDNPFLFDNLANL